MWGQVFFMSTYDDFTDEELQELVDNSNSIREVLIACGLSPVGANYKVFRGTVKKRNIDISGIGDRLRKKRSILRVKMNEKAQPYTYDWSDHIHRFLVKDGPNIRTSKLGKKLVELNIKEYKCECCGIQDWNDKDITLQLHHINGDSKDNRLSNLRILCPNCHSLQPTHRGRNMARW